MEKKNRSFFERFLKPIVEDDQLKFLVVDEDTIEIDNGVEKVKVRVVSKEKHNRIKKIKKTNSEKQLVAS